MQEGYVLPGDQQPLMASEREQYLLMAYPFEMAVFEATEQMEETIIRWMHRIISNKSAFTVQVHQQIQEDTAQLQFCLADQGAFAQLANELKVVSQFISSYQCREMYFNLRPAIQHQLLCHSPSYTITELVLLRKPFGQEQYRQVNVFALKP